MYSATLIYSRYNTTLPLVEVSCTQHFEIFLQKKFKILLSKFARALNLTFLKVTFLKEGIGESVKIKKPKDFFFFLQKSRRIFLKNKETLRRRALRPSKSERRYLVYRAHVHVYVQKKEGLEKYGAILGAGL